MGDTIHDIPPPPADGGYLLTDELKGSKLEFGPFQ